MDADTQAAGTLYIDGHVRVYHGELTKPPRRYVSRERLCLRGTTDYWVNDATGRPFFVIEKAIDPGMRHWASNIRIIRASCSKRQFNLLVYAALCMDKIPSRESGFANIPKATAGTSLVVQCGRT